MHNEKKKHIYTLKGFKSANENHTSYLDVLKSSPHGKDEDQNHRSLVNPKSFVRWLKPWSWHTFSGDGNDDGAYDSSFLSLEMEGDSLEKIVWTLTLKGVFIGFLSRLKWLEPTWA